MKTKRSPFGFSFAKTALLVALSLTLAALPARATLLFSGVDLKDAGRTTQWAAFALTGGITVSDFTPQSPFAAVGGGNIGVAGGNITLSGAAKVDGNAYIRTGGSLKKTGTAFVAGTTFQGTQDALMNQVKADAIAASAQAAALASFDMAPELGRTGWFSVTTVNQNSNLTLTDNVGGSHFVLNLTDFVLSGGATFTLTGSAATTYVINVSGKFSLIGAQIILSGVAPENVLFNVTGTGNNITINSGANFQGFLLATQRTVNLTGGATANGTIIAATLNSSGGSKITKPTYLSP